MGKVITILLLSGLCSVLSAQTNVAADQSQPAASGAEPSVKAVALDSSVAAALPGTVVSRLVSEQDLDAYVESISSTFLIKRRTHDPFGQNQDPDAKPIVKANPTKIARRAPQISATPFNDIIQLIVVTTIMPGEKRFLVGSRIVRQGDKLSLNFRSKLIAVEVTEVTSRQIGFRNVETKEVGYRKLDMLPEGMTSGKGGITPAGMVTERRDAPIDLDAVSQSQ